MDLQAASGPSAVLERDGGAPEFQRALQPIMSMDDQAAVHEAIENHRYNPGAHQTQKRHRRSLSARALSSKRRARGLGGSVAGSTCTMERGVLGAHMSGSLVCCSKQRTTL
jgi:hypothetical protein